MEVPVIPPELLFRKYASEIASRLAKERGGKMWVGQDIGATIEPSVIVPGQYSLAELQIPSNYFEGFTLTEEETKFLVFELVRSLNFSDRSGIAQAGGVTHPQLVHYLEPINSIHDLVGLEDGIYGIRVGVFNSNPHRYLAFSAESTPLLRLYLPGTYVSGYELQQYATHTLTGDFELIDAPGNVVTEPSKAVSVRVPLKRFALYQDVDGAIQVDDLRSGDRDELDRKIGLSWNEPPKDQSSFMQMIVGETDTEITLPNDMAAIILPGVEDMRPVGGSFIHQNSRVIDAGFSGRIRTEQWYTGNEYPPWIELRFVHV